ncbi:aminoglycoside phosphotransferase family protein [Alloactinosynnema sp. L-07]|uniref:aminoglycoside phosphotransferase family protein n=1 Tax=Alloactinosynnema sp. L-07 TaxID=1653480 RepID=UPI001560996C|nr:aminoglycoside phosphotransferase family protein [Alloactinosynnema sp. L-07]
MGVDEPTAERVATAVEQLMPDTGPVRPVSVLRKGRSHASWVLDSAVGPLVGKVLLCGDRDVVRRRIAEHQRVWECGVPVPRVLGVTRSSPAAGGRLLIVSQYRSGQDAQDAAATVSATAVEEVMRATGAALNQLHQVPVPAFGDQASGLFPGPRTWSAVVDARVELLHSAYRDHDPGVSDGVIEAGLTLLAELATEVSPVVRAGTAHLDLYLPNILCDPDGRFLMLLDMEHLRWVDPVMDFVKPAMWMFDGQPGWAEAFVDGYRSAGAWPDRWSQRLAVASGWELLTGVDYWSRVRDTAMREDYLRRLRAWVRSDGAGHVWPQGVR